MSVRERELVLGFEVAFYQRTIGERKYQKRGEEENARALACEKVVY